MFSVKKLLSVDDLTTNYLVYSPCVYNRPDDNWLLDVELYSEEFRADLISIWMDEMRLILNPSMRKQVKNYRAYFNALFTGITIEERTELRWKNVAY